MVRGAGHRREQMARAEDGVIDVVHRQRAPAASLDPVTLRERANLGFKGPPRLHLEGARSVVLLIERLEALHVVAERNALFETALGNKWLHGLHDAVLSFTHEV